MSLDEEMRKLSDEAMKAADKQWIEMDAGFKRALSIPIPYPHEKICPESGRPCSRANCGKWCESINCCSYVVQANFTREIAEFMYDLQKSIKEFVKIYKGENK